MNELRDPTESLAHGAMILFAGALLLPPGFFTAAVGFSLLVPPFRSALFRGGAAKFAGSVRVSTFGAGAAPGSRPGPMGRGPGDVVDGEFTDLDEGEGPAAEAPPETPTEALPPRKPGASGWTRE